MTQRNESGIQHPWALYRRPDDTCCPCPYCSAYREGKLPKVNADPSPWLRRMGGMPAR